MDIIKQRVENINRNASVNKSTTDLFDDSFNNSVKGTPTLVENGERITTTPATHDTPNGQLKPLKRKLFAPPSLFPENSPISTLTPQKTDKKTTTQKRKRNDSAVTDKPTKTGEKPHVGSKKTNSRRSTMYFEEAPTQKKDSANGNSNASTVSTMTAATALGDDKHCASPGLVFTSMHQPQIDFITEVCRTLHFVKILHAVYRICIAQF